MLETLQFHLAATPFNVLTSVEITPQKAEELSSDGKFYLDKFLTGATLKNVNTLYEALTGEPRPEENNFLMGKLKEAGNGYKLERMYGPSVYYSSDYGLVLRWGMKPIILDLNNPPQGVDFDFGWQKLQYDEFCLTVSVEMENGSILEASFKINPYDWEAPFDEASAKTMAKALKKGNLDKAGAIAPITIVENDEGKLEIQASSSGQGLPAFKVNQFEGAVEIQIENSFQFEASFGKSYILTSSKGSIPMNHTSDDGETKEYDQYKIFAPHAVKTYLENGGKVPFTLQITPYPKKDGTQGARCSILNATFDSSEGGLDLAALVG